MTLETETVELETEVKEDDELLPVAAGVLEIYSDGKPDAWKRVRETYPELIDRGRAAPGMPYKKFSAESVVVWAAGIVAGDTAKQAMAARVFQKLTTIAFDKEATPTIRLNALRLLGWECGMFNQKTRARSKPAFRTIRRVIVDPKENSAKRIDTARKDD